MELIHAYADLERKKSDAEKKQPEIERRALLLQPLTTDNTDRSDQIRSETVRDSEAASQSSQLI